MKNLLVFDTETTGIPNWKTPSGGEDQPHIVQLAAHVVDVESRAIKQSINVIIKPNGWVIPDDTIELHGITNEYAHAHGIPEEFAVAVLLEMWKNCDIRVAHNTTFDNRIIRIATKRYMSDEVIESWKAGEYFCTMINSKKIIGGKNPKLSEAYKHFTGDDLKNAHSAIADTNACLKVYWGIQDHLKKNLKAA